MTKGGSKYSLGSCDVMAGRLAGSMCALQREDINWPCRHMFYIINTADVISINLPEIPGCQGHWGNMQDNVSFVDSLGAIHFICTLDMHYSSLGRACVVLF